MQRAHSSQKSSIDLKSLREEIDFWCSFLSPLACFLFLLFTLATLDLLGAHAQLVSALHHGSLTTATWRGLSYDRDTGYLEFDHSLEEDPPSYIYTQYYSPATLAALQEGQSVRIRYTTDYRVGSESVLADAFDEVRVYTGWLAPYFWPLLISALVAIVRAEYLFAGLPTGPVEPLAEEKRP